MASPALGKGLGPCVLPDYVWLDTPEKGLHVDAARLEFREDARPDRSLLMRMLLGRAT